jgi:nitroreductase
MERANTELNGHNSILDAIYQRRAVRRYLNKPVSRELTEKIIDAGRMAPSAINKQPWHFHVMDDLDSILILSASILSSTRFNMLKEGLKEAIHTLLHPGSFHLKDALDFLRSEDPIFHGAPLVIFISSPIDSEWACLDVGMCAQNMMLAAWSMGLSSCPVGLAKFVEKSDHYALLKVPDGHHVNLALIFGYSDENPDVHERNKNNIYWIPPIQKG